MFIISKRLTAFIALSTLFQLGFSNLAHADVGITFNGFANLGLTYSSNDDLLFRRSILNDGHSGFSVKPDSILGLQTSLKFSKNLDAVGQVILQDRQSSAFTNFLELAFFRYQFNRHWLVKAGRFSTNAYLFTDSRHVSYSFNWARAPIDMYSPAGAVGTLNGIQVEYVTSIDWGTLKVSGALGETKFSDPEVTRFEVDYNNMQIFSAELSRFNWRVQLAHVRADLENVSFDGVEQIKQLDNFVPPVLTPFINELQANILGTGQTISFTSIGGTYSTGDYELVAEHGFYQSDWSLGLASAFSYISLAKTFANLTGFITYSEVDRRKAIQVIDEAAAEQALPAPLLAQLGLITDPLRQKASLNSADQQSFIAGVRWDFAVKWAAKIQLNHVRVTDGSIGLFLLEGSGSRSAGNHVNILNLSLSTTF